MACPADDGPATTGAGSAGSSTGASTTTEPDTTTGGTPSDACTCFETTSESFTVTCSFDGYRDCGWYEGCWEGGGSSSGGEACPSPALEAANAEFVECTLELLTAGQPGTFGSSSSDYGGQYSSSSHFVANGDGSTLYWTHDVDDLDTHVSAVTHHNAPDATAIQGCADEPTTEQKWSCISWLVAGATLIETCTDPVSWSWS